MMTALEFIEKITEQKKEAILDANCRIHDFAELAYEETQSAALLCGILEKEGFQVKTGLAQMPTCFTGTWGSGKPVMGFLGEFDALDQLSQERGNPERKPVREGAPGHGCGHCCLGTASLGAAVAVKEYLEANSLEGTVIYYGCPAEEGAGSKQFMARAGLFDGTDFVYTWHPSSTNDVSNMSSTAIMGANFSFYGKTAHAGMNPWAGRSALDAAELMSVGANYLREHIEDGERIHYAYANAGGTAPNVVPACAKVKYEVRSRNVKKVKRLFERVVRVAQGAAMMTETEMKYEITMAFSDSRNNPVLAKIASDALKEVGAPEWDREDCILAKRFLDSYDKETRKLIRMDMETRFGKERAGELWERPLHEEVIGYDPEQIIYDSGSTDVGDVTYTVPTCEIHVATAALGTIEHTWQMTGQSGSRIGEKGLLTAMKVMALSCIRTMEQPEKIEEARKETLSRNGGSYECPLPEYVVPPVGKY